MLRFGCLVEKRKAIKIFLAIQKEECSKHGELASIDCGSLSVY